MFKFTIRDLLWLTLVVAIGLGWLVRERRLRAEANAAAAQAERWRIRSFLEHPKLFKTEDHIGVGEE